MALIGLNLPTDILWERVCVTKDMLDANACDIDAPPRWQSSIAIFKYVPKEEYQLYPGRKIIYYKVTCTLTGYQAKSDEIEGLIDWNKMNPTEIADFEAKLKTYKPCNGAVIQVTVVPPIDSGLKVEQYPYFLDFQPKQRAMYEQASDTDERTSRSLESSTIKKGGGTSDSLEVLDVDKGYSVGVQGSAAGFGAGVSVSKQGEWGSKRLSQENADNVRTSDSVRELRDTVSHTTQISQMYTLFQAYHLGTNRAMFFVSPRPHVLEQPSGFIEGPRAIDGIQEIILIVSSPDNVGDPCLSIRLDTSHLVHEDIMDYDRSTAAMPLHIDLDVPAPTSEDPDKVRVDSDVGGGIDKFYDCYELHRSAVDVSPDKPGFLVESVEVLNEDLLNATYSANVSADGRTVTLKGEAHSHVCMRNSLGDTTRAGAISSAVMSFGTDGTAIAVAISLADERKNESPGHAHCMVNVRVRSEKETVKVGETWHLLVVSRGLCCCDDRQPENPVPPDQQLIAVEVLDPWIHEVLSRPPIRDPRAPLDGLTAAQPNIAAARAGLAARAMTMRASSTVTAPMAKAPVTMTARQANAISSVVTDATRRVAERSAARRPAKGELERSYLMRRAAAVAHRAAWVRLDDTKLRTRPGLSAKTISGLAATFKVDSPTLPDLLFSNDDHLMREMELDERGLMSLRLSALGIPVRRK
jgi:hypothetical protein